MRQEQVEVGGGVARVGGTGELAEGGGQAGKGLGATGSGLLEGAADLLDFPRVEVGGEHLAGAVHQIVGLVHEEGVVAGLVGEVAAEIDLGVENVVVVADDHVHPGGEVERKLEGADLVRAADLFEEGAGDFLAAEGVAHGGLAAVVVAAGERAGGGVAGLTFMETDLLFGGEGEGAEAGAGVTEVGEGLLGDGASDGAGGEVKDAFELAFTEGLDGGEEDRDSFADAGGGFEEEASAADEGAIGGDGEAALAGAVAREGEREWAGGLVALPAPTAVGPEPVEVDCGCLVEEGGEVGEGEAAAEFGEFGGVEVEVG